MILKRCFAALLLLLFLNGCGSGAVPTASRQEGSSSASPVSSLPAAQASESEAVSEPPPHESAPLEFPAKPASSGYLNRLIEQAAVEFAAPDMTEYERAKAAFDYLIERTTLDEPIGLELWRVHGGGDAPIPFLEQRALSPLRFGIGMCEDYAAALTLLLRGLGLQAEYVPGLTYSLEGHLVDHAWTLVCVDGVWYHLDCQLEDNISRHGAIRYRYFLKSDAAMAGSHRWGQNLIDSGLLTPEQNAEIAEHYLAPACPRDYPPPKRREMNEAPAPDLEALRAQARAELTAYESGQGPLPVIHLNVIPPVFGLEGFGPSDEG